MPKKFIYIYNKVLKTNKKENIFKNKLTYLYLKQILKTKIKYRLNNFPKL